MNVSATFTYVPAIRLGDALMPATCFLKYNFSKIHIMVVRVRNQKVNGVGGLDQLHSIILYYLLFSYLLVWGKKNT